MKTSKNILSFLLLLAGSVVTAQAQDSIVDRNVTVEREYKPVIQDAGKINSVPKVLEPKVEKTEPDYSDFNLPLTADFNIHTLPAAELQREKRPESKGGFARIGFGNHYNTLVDFAYPVIKKPDLRLDFSLNHLGTFDQKAHSTTKAALSFDKYFKSFDIYAGVGGGHEYFKYYGDNFNRDTTVNLKTLAMNPGTINYREKRRTGVIDNTPLTFDIGSLANDSTSNTFWRFNAFVGARSLPLTTGLRYQVEMEYNVLNSVYGFGENFIHTKALLNKKSKLNRAGLDVDMYNLMYNSKNGNRLNFWDAYTVVALNPYYSIERKHFDVRLGVKSSFSFVPGRILFNPSPDVRAEWKIVPKYASIYGGIGGGYEVNTMNSMLSENRFLFQEIRVKDTYTPIDFFAGIKLKPVYNLLLDAYIDYRLIDNQYFFVNKEYNLENGIPPAADYTLYTNRFDVVYSSASHTKIGVRANYNLRNRVNVELKGAYNKWTVSNEQFAWNKPVWEADLSTDVHVTRNLSVSANAFFEGVRYAKLGDTAVRMRPKVDINLGTSYNYNNWLTAFAKINNLINNPYQDYYGYEVQGTNVMVGAAFSF